MTNGSSAGRYHLARFSAGVLARALAPASTVALALALGCVIAGAGVSALAPIALKSLLDDLAGSAASAVFFGLFYAGCLGLARLAAEGRAFFFGRAEQDIVRVLTLKAADHVLSLPMRFFRNASSGSLVQTLENGLTGYRLLLQHSVFTLLPGLLEIAVISIIILTVLDAAFLAVLAACAAAYAAIFAGGTRKVLGVSRDVSAARITVTSQLADVFLNIETVKAFSGEAALAGRLDASLLETRRSWRRFHSVRCRNGVLVALVFTAGLLAVLVMSLDRIGAGEMTPGGLVLISAYLLQIVRPMELLGFAARDIGQGAAFLERLNAILREAPEAGESHPAGPQAEAPGPMAVCFDEVSFAHADGRQVLSDISLDIVPGMKVALVGASGSGKSTFLRLILRFYEPSGGQVFIDGRPLSGISPRDLRRQIAFIPQEPGLFNDTLPFNIGFPDAEVPCQETDAALRRVRLCETLTGTAEGRGVPAGEGGSLLSGGERQRVAIARALMRRPRLVLADEPTSALDPETEAAIVSELETAFTGTTMILATHRLRSVRHADLIYVMSAGRIVERGVHDALLAGGGAYARLWQAQNSGGGRM